MIISEHKQTSVNRKGTSWKTFLGYYNLVLLFIIITLGSIVLTPLLTLCINGNNKVGSIKSFCWFNYKFKKFKIIHAPKSSVSFPCSIPGPTMHCDLRWQSWRINLSHARCFSTNFPSKTLSTCTAYQPPPTDNHNVTISSRLCSPKVSSKF